VLKQIFGTDQITFKDCGTWHRTKMTARRRLVAKARDVFRAAGYPFVLTQAFDRRTPSHQRGTVRMGTDPATSVLDVFCRTHDHQLVRGGCSLPADLGGGKSFADHRCPGAARCRPYRPAGIPRMR
jgi:hypothetical protein